jgi:hypothetical protein
MRSSHTAATVVALTGLATGLTALVALRHRAGRRSPAPARIAEPVPAAPATFPVRDGVVLPFARPVPAAATAPQPVRPAHPARCGETGGRTKAGAPCAARASAAGRCHHHQVAA